MTRVRSAITGRFVKSNQAKRSPRTTITARIPIARRRQGKGAKPKFTRRVRSAATGRFVKTSQAGRSPRTTITERIPIARRRPGETRKKR